MKKSRKQRKKEFKNLQKKTSWLEANKMLAKLDLEAEKKATEMYKKRLMDLGLDEKLNFAPLPRPLQIMSAEVNVSQFGQYMYAPDVDGTDDMIESVKGILVRDLVKGLMDNGIVRFIVKKGDSPLDIGHQAIGATLAVVPWEQLTERSIRFKCFMREGKKND